MISIEDFKKLNVKTLESGQKIVEIEPNTWVDYDTYNPDKPIITPNEVTTNGG